MSLVVKILIAFIAITAIGAAAGVGYIYFVGSQSLERINSQSNTTDEDFEFVADPPVDEFGNLRWLVYEDEFSDPSYTDEVTDTSDPLSNETPAYRASNSVNGQLVWTMDYNPPSEWHLRLVGEASRGNITEIVTSNGKTAIKENGQWFEFPGDNNTGDITFVHNYAQYAAWEAQKTFGVPIQDLGTRPCGPFTCQVYESPLNATGGESVRVFLDTTEPLVRSVEQEITDARNDFFPNGTNVIIFEYDTPVSIQYPANPQRS